jgi:hypothetical protein
MALPQNMAKALTLGEKKIFICEWRSPHRHLSPVQNKIFKSQHAAQFTT